MWEEAWRLFELPIIGHETSQLVRPFPPLVAPASGWLEFTAAIYFWPAFAAHVAWMGLEWLRLCFPFTSVSAFVVHFI